MQPISQAAFFRNRLLTAKICYVTNTFTCGAVAQLGERLNGIQEVESSILFGSTTKRKAILKGSPFSFNLA